MGERGQGLNSQGTLRGEGCERNSVEGCSQLYCWKSSTALVHKLDVVCNFGKHGCDRVCHPIQSLQTKTFVNRSITVNILSP